MLHLSVKKWSRAKLALRLAHERGRARGLTWVSFSEDRLLSTETCASLLRRCPQEWEGGLFHRFPSLCPPSHSPTPKLGVPTLTRGRPSCLTADRLPTTPPCAFPPPPRGYSFRLLGNRVGWEGHCATLLVFHGHPDFHVSTRFVSRSTCLPSCFELGSLTTIRNIFPFSLFRHPNSTRVRVRVGWEGHCATLLVFHGHPDFHVSTRFVSRSTCSPSCFELGSLTTIRNIFPFSLFRHPNST